MLTVKLFNCNPPACMKYTYIKIYDDLKLNFDFNQPKRQKQ